MEGTHSLELRALSNAASMLVREGWARSSSGNISLRSRSVLGAFPTGSFPILSKSMATDRADGTLLWISRTGCTMVQLSKDPTGNAGLYRSARDRLDLLSGTGPPSTEATAHLLVIAGTGQNACVHCHWDDIVGISDRALKVALPDSIGATPSLPPGSIELAEATLREAMYHHTVLWPYHGIFATGRDLDDCLSNLRRARKFFDGPEG